MMVRYYLFPSCTNISNLYFLFLYIILLKLFLSPSFKDFRWPALRFGWKRKIAAGNTGLPALPTSMAQEVDTATNSLPTEEVAKETKPSTKPLRPASKTLKSNPSGAAMMDIGVWNPNAVQENDETRN